MPVLKKTAKTTKDALPHSSSSTISTSTNMAMLLMCWSQHIKELDISGTSPSSRLRLTSYKPMAKKGPTSKQPETNDKVYSGLCLNTKASTCAMPQKHRP